jgi:hypothetical protein
LLFFFFLSFCLTCQEVFADPSQSSSPEKSQMLLSSDILNASTTSLVASQGVPNSASNAVSPQLPNTTPLPSNAAMIQQQQSANKDGGPKPFAFKAVIPGLANPLVPSSTPVPTSAITTQPTASNKPFSFNAIIPGLNIATTTTSTPPKSMKLNICFCRCYCGCLCLLVVAFFSYSCIVS